MGPQLSLRGFLTHPITTFTVAFGTVAHLVTFAPIDALAATVWGNVGGLFSVTSIFASLVAPQISWIPQRPLIIASILLFAVIVVKKGRDWWADYQRRIQ